MARFLVSAPQSSALFLITSLGHGFAMALACLSPRAPEIPSGTAYVLILLGCSALLAVPLAHWPHDVCVSAPILGLKTGIAMLLFIPLWFPSPLKIMVLCIVVVETVFVLPWPWDIAGSLVALACVIGTQTSRTLWDISVQAAGLDELAALVCIPASAGILARGYRDALVRLDRSIDDADRLRDGSQAIIMANVRFQEQAQEADDDSSERERKRISREVHDVVGYTITNQTMAMEAALVLLDQDDQRERLRALLESALEQSREGLAEVRSALHALRSQQPPYIDFQNRMSHICLTFNRATGVEVVCEVLDRNARIPAGLDMVLYRIVQAGLTNSFLHGRARKVRVRIQDVEGMLHLSVQDDGVGSQIIAEGIGLAGMRERLAPFGGELSYMNTGIGFLVKVTVPLKGAGGSR